jgi:hypothetical protein
MLSKGFGSHVPDLTDGPDEVGSRRPVQHGHATHLPGPVMLILTVVVALVALAVLAMIVYATYTSPSSRAGRLGVRGWPLGRPLIGTCAHCGR